MHQATTARVAKPKPWAPNSKAAAHQTFMANSCCVTCCHTAQALGTNIITFKQDVWHWDQQVEATSKGGLGALHLHTTSCQHGHVRLNRLQPQAASALGDGSPSWTRACTTIPWCNNLKSNSEKEATTGSHTAQTGLQHTWCGCRPNRTRQAPATSAIIPRGPTGVCPSSPAMRRYAGPQL